MSQCALLLLAGNLTTTDMIGNGVLALLENPEQLAPEFRGMSYCWLTTG